MHTKPIFSLVLCRKKTQEQQTNKEKEILEQTLWEQQKAGVPQKQSFTT
jgi:hypothetical protein